MWTDSIVLDATNDALSWLADFNGLGHPPKKMRTVTRALTALHGALDELLPAHFDSDSPDDDEKNSPFDNSVAADAAPLPRTSSTQPSSRKSTSTAPPAAPATAQSSRRKGKVTDSKSGKDAKESKPQAFDPRVRILSFLSIWSKIAF